MCRLSSLMLAFMMTFLIITSTSVEAAKKVVAVMPLENVSGYNKNQVAEIMTEELVSTIYKSGIYTVVERNQLASMLREQGFQMGGTVNPHTAVKVGKMFGAQYAVIGKVTLADISENKPENMLKNVLGNILGEITKKRPSKTLTGKINLNFRFINVETGEIAFMADVKGTGNGESNETAFNKACKNAAEEALKEIQKHNPWSARIADLSDETIYIDQGRESGISAGETLIVFREGAPIIINDKIVGMKQTEIGTAVVTEVNEEYSICRVTSSKSTVRKGDIVKRG